MQGAHLFTQAGAQRAGRDHHLAIVSGTEDEPRQHRLSQMESLGTGALKLSLHRFVRQEVSADSRGLTVHPPPPMLGKRQAKLLESQFRVGSIDDAVKMMYELDAGGWRQWLESFLSADEEPESPPSSGPARTGGSSQPSSKAASPKPPESDQLSLVGEERAQQGITEAELLAEFTASLVLICHLDNSGRRLPFAELNYKYSEGIVTSVHVHFNKDALALLLQNMSLDDAMASYFC